MINYYFRSVKEDTLQTTNEPRPGTWVYAEQPSDSELDTISEKFGLNRDLLKDAVDIHEVPRFEFENDISYFFTRFPHVSSNGRTATILIAVTPTEVITVSNEHPLIFDEYINNKTPIITTQRTKLFLLLISANNKGYYNELVSIGRKIQRSRVNLHNIKNRDITMLVELESTLNEYINALVSSTSAIKKILSGDHLKLYDEDKDIIEDIQLEKQQQLETAKTNLKTIQNIRNAYTTIITNNLNSVIKLLTSLTIILTIPTIISSMYGMNVGLPFSNYRHTFSAILIVTILIMTIVTFIFKKQDWL